MDEPFAALDALTREQLYGDLQQIFGWTQRGYALVRARVDHIGRVLAAFAAGNIGKPAVEAERLSA